MLIVIGERIVDICNGNLHISMYTLPSENTSPFECKLWEENSSDTFELKALGKNYNNVNS